MRKKVIKNKEVKYGLKFDEPSPAGNPEELSNWIDNLHDLQALRSVKSADDLKHALRIHLGMIKEEVSQDDDLNEFRSAGNSSSSSSSVQETVREDFSVTNSSEPKAAEEEVLADDDFMKELADM